MPAKKKAPPEPTRSFEEALAELEARVRRLDQGDLALEDALTLFEEGVALQRECQELLDSTERRVIELSATAGAISERPVSGEPG